DPFAHQACAGAVAALTGNAYLLDPQPPRRRFDHVDPPADLAPIFVGWHEEIWLEGNEQIATDFIRRPCRGGQGTQCIHRQREAEALVSALCPTEGKQCTPPRGGSVDGRLAVRPKCYILRDRCAETGAELQISAHKRRCSHVDDKRIAVGRKTEGNWVRAE